MKKKSLIHSIFDFKGGPLLAAGVGLLFILETRFALRKRKESRWLRVETNVAVAATAGVGLRLALIPAIVETARWAESNHFGLLRFLRLPPFLATAAGFLLLDYGNYLWHILNHRSRFLWRFHQVHHADLDLDVTTALRFHLGEILASIFFRGAWVAAVGASPRLVLVYEVFFEGATNFHHSNLRLPEKADRALAHLIVTPRLHGIHHSIVRNETDSNYCIIFTFWDRLHRTLRRDIPQSEINIGVPYVRRHLKAWELFKMPAALLAEWKLPDGTVPQRQNNQ